MKHISVLIPEGDSSLSNLEATFKMFSMANDTLLQMGKQKLFDVHVVGLDRNARRSTGVFTIQPDQTIYEVKKTDLIIIPAIHGDKTEILKANSAFIPWMIARYKEGAEIASLCIGAFLLAKTGLLKGRSCATHWLAADEFRAMFPDVNLVDEKIMTDENGIYTSGGAYSSLNLNLYLLEKYAGREMAVLSSKIFEIDIERNSQSPFIIFRGQKDHDDAPIKSAQEYIEQHYDSKLTVDEIASKISLTRRSLERRFKSATSNTIVEYMQRVKIEAAKKQLESGRKNINEVMYDVGYNDTKAFRSVFQKVTGMSPLAYRNKFRKVGAN